jgi:DNA-directed RNA polymerase specialized sigma24 family protein
MAERDKDDGAGQELLRQFDRERDNRAVATELVTRLRVQMLVQLRRHWRSKTYAWDDLESAALVRLVEWRQAGKLRNWEGSLALLAYRLLEVEIETERIHRTLEKDIQGVIDADPELVFSPALDPERSAMARELLRKTLELIAKLPEEYEAVFQALIDEEQDGPRMEVALGITRGAAEARLKRARVALLNLAADANLAGELKDFLESEG